MFFPNDVAHIVVALNQLHRLGAGVGGVRVGAGVGGDAVEQSLIERNHCEASQV